VRQALTQLVAENYPRIATDLLAPILDLLRLAREYCDGDVDKFLVIVLVAIRTTKHPDFAKLSPQQLISGEVPVFPGLGTNARSIAQSLDIPKETIRRKVAELIDAGWLVRDRSRLYFTAHAYQKLAPVREQIERLAVLNYEAVSKLLPSQARPL
jgi:hypothetical protein